MSGSSLESTAEDFGRALTAMLKAMCDSGMDHEDAMRVMCEYVRAIATPRRETTATTLTGLFGSGGPPS